MIHFFQMLWHHFYLIARRVRTKQTFGSPKRNSVTSTPLLYCWYPNGGQELDVSVCFLPRRHFRFLSTAAPLTVPRAITRVWCGRSKWREQATEPHFPSEPTSSQPPLGPDVTSFDLVLLIRGQQYTTPVDIIGWEGAWGALNGKERQRMWKYQAALNKYGSTRGYQTRTKKQRRGQVVGFCCCCCCCCFCCCCCCCCFLFFFGGGR